jgi:hypothetical protein
MDFRSHGRIVALSKSNSENASIASGLIFIASMIFYYRKVYRVNTNILRFALFVPANYLVSGFFGRALTLDPREEAAIINNT